MFWWGTGLCVFLGVGLGAWALAIQSHTQKISHRQESLAQALNALAATLQRHAALPFRPTPTSLKALAELTRVQGALGLLEAGEGHPDADRQSFLEGELADHLRACERERANVRAEAALSELRAAFHHTATVVEALRQQSSLPPEAWDPEWEKGCAAVGLPTWVLVDAEHRLARVQEAGQAFEDALGIALADAQRLHQPGYEVVGFSPDPKRTRLSGNGWAASGFGVDVRVPGRTVAFTVEGSALVHKLLNLATWRGLARVAAEPQGRLRYEVDLATYQLGEQGDRRVARVIETAATLSTAWKACNPKAPELRFESQPQKAFDDIFVELEANPEAGTPDGKPDLELWPTEGEIATVKDYFGVHDDLILLRFPHAGSTRVHVLARKEATYTHAALLTDGELVVLPGGILLRVVEVQIPSLTTPQAFKSIQVLARPAPRKPKP